MSQFINQHRLHPVIERTFTLDEHVAALKPMQSGNLIGKIVIAL